MFEVQEALDAQKEEFQRREATFKRREEMLKKKDLELQESLIKFNKFLQENDSKRSRAEKKEKEEIKQRLVKEQEITKLHEALQRQKEQRRLMTLELDKMMKYQFFLESVLDSTEEFPEITDLLSRYDTLDAAHSDLISRQVQARARLQKVAGGQLSCPSSCGRPWPPACVRAHQLHLALACRGRRRPRRRAPSSRSSCETRRMRFWRAPSS